MNKIKESFKKLSSREKVLIYILVILLILCFGWLIVLQPQLTKNSTLKSEKDAYELQLSELQNTGTTQETVDIVKLNQEVKELSDLLYNKMTKEDIDKLVTELATTHRIVPKTLSMSEITQTDLSTNSSSDTSSSDTTTDENKKQDASSANVYTCVVQQTCTGTQTQLEKLLDDVKNTNGIYITSVSYENKPGNLDLSITYTIYMVEK